MSASHPLITGAFATLGLAALSQAAPPQAAMAVDLGLWELSSQPKLSDAPPIPQSQLAQMTPEQRQMIAKVMAGASRAHIWKSCMTEEKRAHGFPQNDKEGNCKTTVITNTSAEYESHRECSSDEGTSVESSHWKIASRQQASGEVEHVLTAPDGRSMTVHHSIQAKWVAADCGEVK